MDGNGDKRSRQRLLSILGDEKTLEIAELFELKNEECPGGYLKIEGWGKKIQYLPKGNVRPSLEKTFGRGG